MITRVKRLKDTVIKGMKRGGEELIGHLKVRPYCCQREKCSIHCPNSHAWFVKKVLALTSATHCGVFEALGFPLVNIYPFHHYVASLCANGQAAFDEWHSVSSSVSKEIDKRCGNVTSSIPYMYFGIFYNHFCSMALCREPQASRCCNFNTKLFCALNIYFEFVNLTNSFKTRIRNQNTISPSCFNPRPLPPFTGKAR